MLWRWSVIVICGIMVLACSISTMADWVRGKTGPLGPKAWDWWGCGIFTLLLLGIIYWAVRPILGY